MICDVLMTEGLPDRTLAPGDIVFSEGEPSSSVIVLVDGELVIEAGGAIIDRHLPTGDVWAFSRAERAKTPKR